MVFWNLRSKFKQSGLSMVELLIGVGLVGAISLGVGQMITNSNKQVAKFNDKFELKNLIQKISLEYSRGKVCSEQFGGDPIPGPYNILETPTRPLLHVTDKVVSDHFEVLQMETEYLDKSRFDLKITFKDLKTPGKEIIERISIPAKIDIDPADNQMKILNCYDLSSNPDLSGMVAASCQGPGVLPYNSTDTTCTIKGFQGNNFPNCAPGQAFVNFNVLNDGNYAAVCADAVEKVCTENSIGHIQSHGNNGEINCVDLSAYVDPTPRTIAANDQCQAKVVAGKLKFDCTAGSAAPDDELTLCGTPGNPPCPTSCPDAYCPAQNTYCPGENIDNGCGTLCPTGTKTGPTCGWGCFTAGTLVELLNGERKNIEDVKVGETLLDGSKNKVVVEKVIVLDYFGLIYSINGGGYFFTPNHPFLTLEGWKSLSPVSSNKETPGLNVTLLKKGDILVKRDGLEMIHSLDYIPTEEKVYNFQLNNSNVYMANDYVVHNKMDCPHVTCTTGMTCNMTEMPYGYASQFCNICYCN